MRNTEPVIDLLCAAAVPGAVIDQEPYPVGEVLGVSEMTLEAKMVQVRISSRVDSSFVEGRFAVLYAVGNGANGREVVPLARMEVPDAS